MDPIEIFKLTLASNDPQRDITKINDKWMIHNKYNNSYSSIDNDRLFARIKNCINARSGKIGLFKCSCGICSSYLMGKVYNQFFNKDKILDDVLDEMYNKPDQPAQAPPVNLIPQAAQPAAEPAPKSTTNEYDTILINFGKYKDKTFKEIFDIDKSYCLWCIESCAVEEAKGNKPSFMMYQFVNYIKLRIKLL